MSLQHLPPHQAHLNPLGADGPESLYGEGILPISEVLTEAYLIDEYRDHIMLVMAKKGANAEDIKDLEKALIKALQHNNYFSRRCKFTVLLHRNKLLVLLLNAHYAEHINGARALLSDKGEDAKFYGAGRIYANRKDEPWYQNIGWGSESCKANPPEGFGFDRPQLSDQNSGILLLNIQQACQNKIAEIAQKHRTPIVEE
ncbi:MAG: hypothetical protein WC753_01050 [Candidatus Gracilibacteria bacterium]